MQEIALGEVAMEEGVEVDVDVNNVLTLQIDNVQPLATEDIGKHVEKVFCFFQGHEFVLLKFSKN